MGPRHPLDDGWRAHHRAHSRARRHDQGARQATLGPHHARRGFIAFWSALAEDERQRIVKRANEGRAAARKRGVHMGRQPKLTDLPDPAPNLGRATARDQRARVWRVGSGERFTLTKVGEAWLSDWLAAHALVRWREHLAPWKLEAELLRMYSLPLNIQGNDHRPFHSTLRRIRAEALKTARELPICKIGRAHV